MCFGLNIQRTKSIIALHIVFADPAYAVYIAYKAKAAEKQNEPDIDRPIRHSDLSLAI